MNEEVCRSHIIIKLKHKNIHIGSIRIHGLFIYKKTSCGRIEEVPFVVKDEFEAYLNANTLKNGEEIVFQTPICGDEFINDNADPIVSEVKTIEFVYNDGHRIEWKIGKHGFKSHFDFGVNSHREYIDIIIFEFGEGTDD